MLKNYFVHYTRNDGVKCKEEFTGYSADEAKNSFETLEELYNYYDCASIDDVVESHNPVIN